MFGLFGLFKNERKKRMFGQKGLGDINLYLYFHVGRYKKNVEDMKLTLIYNII